jgi:DNA-binding transcriptional LysR family regulator
MASPGNRPSPELLAPDFSLRQVSYFVATAQHESIQRAAEELHVSPPAVSAAIAHLEDKLGVKLFVRRHARGMVLTDAGSAVAAECRNLLAQAWALGSGRLGSPKEVRGWVHFGCLFSFAPFLVPLLVREYQRRFPKARVYWHEGTHEYLVEGLQNGALEIALTYDFEIPGGIACDALRPAPLQVVLPKGHRLAGRARLGVRDLVREPLVLLDLPRTREYILSAFTTAGVNPRIEYRAHSMTMLRGLVAGGLGYSLLNFCPPYTNDAIGSIVTRPLATGLRAPHIVVARSHRYRPTHAANALIECATDLVKDLKLTSPG